ncbi:hypothetical protein TVAG_454450 [Trichomonas vaginalis G3]|uniref:Uncharacterized protein n=1 Tax=Trichomonas vaginalis (strain ATCC PRA-98 / G3) TaxID=412133 RepID=A2EU58_TRIV3|nr:hypothetical protein TVAGG3_0231570 [Trichomonas vaginalis G3]EAY03806.1 hypothetical protein TVAG_454450 [Trichomonas vaginalis G3]KAI5552672.1 hypothetical protein TVAGG3_0231570 [Trichomonas vaginalis G3]|eukprot:XP_001316029.1 hypothetical protein [Trichomonas vaginalis G3]
MYIHMNADISQCNFSNNYPRSYAVIYNYNDLESTIQNCLVFHNGIKDISLISSRKLNLHHTNFIDNILDNDKTYNLVLASFDKNPYSVYCHNNNNFDESNLKSDLTVQNTLKFKDYCYIKPPKSWTPLILSLTGVIIILLIISIIFGVYLHKRYRKIENRHELERSLQDDFG